MSTSEKATMAQPRMLRWARERANMSAATAAKKAGVAEAVLLGWEAGDDVPTMAKLRKLAQGYGRPIYLFFLSAPPDEPPVTQNFRRLPDIVAISSSSELTLAIREAESRRSTLVKVLSTLGEAPTEFTWKCHAGENPEQVGSRLREFLGVGVPEQTACRTAGAALRMWRDAIERKGVLVFQAPAMRRAESRGLVMVLHPLPIVMMSAEDAPDARIFTLFHELVHLGLDQGSTWEPGTSSETDRIETFCNRVAGEALVPRTDLLNRHSLAEATLGGEVQLAGVADLAAIYRVSLEVVARRLLDLNLVPRDEYLRFRATLMQRPRKKEGGGGSYFRNVVAELGRGYIRPILTAYRHERIGLSDVCDALDVKAKYIARIEEEALA